jgi:hypothetical protein
VDTIRNQEALFKINKQHYGEKRIKTGAEEIRGTTPTAKQQWQYSIDVPVECANQLSSTNRPE